MRHTLLLLMATWAALLAPAPATAYAAYPYPLAAQGLRTIVVHPTRGRDTAPGTTARPIRTLTEAWRRTPTGTLTRGVRIVLLPGNYPAESMPNYWENRRGTARAPIIIQSARGAASVRLSNINMFQVEHLALVGVRMESPNDVFHCERCDHVLIRDSVLRGLGNRSRGEGPQETIKFNQSTNVYIERSYVSGAQDNAVDFVAVHGGHIVGNTIRDAQDWCGYVKGGSNDILVDANTFEDCGTGGFTAGQGTGLEFMDRPWLKYEAYDITIVNNIAQRTFGAGFGVNGGTNIRLANNSSWRVGRRSHVVEFSFGERSCDGDAAGCTERIGLGAWGPSAPGGDPVYIPNGAIEATSNIFANPTNGSSPDQHLFVPDARPSGPGVSEGSTVHADASLAFQGNLIANGPDGHPLGVGEDGQGCQSTNSTCRPTLLRSSNLFVTAGSPFINPDSGNLSPQLTSSLITSTPPSTSASTTTRDRYGVSRTNSSPPGAIVQRMRFQPLSVGAGRGGTVTWLGGPRRGAIAPESGRWALLRATPQRGYRFARWTGVCVGSGSTCAVQATGRHKIRAVFTRRR